jgi:hypothetical protein
MNITFLVEIALDTGKPKQSLPDLAHEVVSYGKVLVARRMAAVPWTA